MAKIKKEDGIVTTSISFRAEVLEGLRAKKIATSRSASWIVNRLVEKWLQSGGKSLE